MTWRWILAIGLALASGTTAGADEAVRADGVVKLYGQMCAACHGERLQGTFGPRLNDAAFAARWRGDADGLAALIAKTMPPSAPGSLTGDQAAGLAAYVLAGQAAATTAADPAASATAAEVSGGAAPSEANTDARYREEMARRDAVLQALAPVTADDLANPAAADWLHRQRTPDAAAYSPLKQIDRGNVARLRPLWSLSLPHGTNEITPVVRDGVMFVNSSGVVTAVEAATGTVLWSFERRVDVIPMGPPVSQPRSMALAGKLLYVPTLDNHLLALDARSGKLVWDHAIEPASQWLRLTVGPQVVRDKIIQGVAGCAGTRNPGGCFIVALDRETGRELWRVNTLQRQGDRGRDTWNGVPDSERFGGSVWGNGTYDAETNLVYYGVAQTYHVAPLLRAPASASANADALYTGATLAIDVDTGRVAWYYQHTARDVWDMDWAYERTLATLPIGGKQRRVVMTMGKLGILDVLDARTGRYLYSQDLGYQNIIAKIDPKTGVKTPAPGAVPRLNETVQGLCPYAAGVRNFASTAYDAATQTLYIPILQACMDFLWHDQSDWDISYALKPPRDGRGIMGGVVALDVVNRRVKWLTESRAPRSTGLVATAGGLLFDGGRDRFFRALDLDTGAVLWQSRLSETPNAFPVTFEAAGQQYVAVVAGGGGPLDSVLPGLTPEFADKSYATVLTVFGLAP